MTSFHLPIAAKAVLLIAALGLLSIAANVFCLQRFNELDRLNTELTTQFAPARLALAEAKGAIKSFGVATYKLDAATEYDAEAAGGIEDGYNEAKGALNNALSYMPATVEDVRRILDKLEIARGIAVDLKNALRRGDRAEAKRIVDLKFDPACDDVTFQMNRLINILGGEARNTEAEVAARGAAMYRTTVGILIAGTGAALLGALLSSHLFIARPLRRMARTMSQMAGGELDVPIAGEVGAMARAVAVFRDNAIALQDAEAARIAETRAGSRREIRGARGHRVCLRKGHSRRRRVGRGCRNRTRNLRARHERGAG